MKQTTFIILGALIVLTLIGAWVYLMFFGTPKDPSQIFTDLGLGGEEESGGEIIPPPPIKEDPVVNLNRPRLRQLTTKPVIGFIEVQATTSDPVFVYYAEAGTGHVYSISLTSGEETRLSNTTVAEANLASFSPLGDAVAIRAKNDRRLSSLVVGTFSGPGEGLDIQPFDQTVSDFRLMSSNTLFYSANSAAGLSIKARDFAKSTDSVLFTVPFFEAKIIWGTSTASTHFVYPKPSYLLDGYLYKYTKGAMGRLPIAGFGLTAFSGAKNSLIYTTVSELTPRSEIYDLTKGTKRELAILTMPEKCTPSLKQADLLWCGYEFKKDTIGLPDTWYRGEHTFKDSLWSVDLKLGGAELLVDTFLASGREIDVTALQAGKSETALYFINKNDNTLWMYEL